MRRQRLEKRRGLYQGFRVLGLRIGIGDDPRARVVMNLLATDDGGANENVELTLAIEAQVAETSGVGTPRHGFEFVDNLHGAKFRRACDAAARKAGRQRLEVGRTLAQSPFDRGDEVLHV